MLQLLEPPITLEDMTASISVSGITFLKVGRYKQRHGTMTNVTQKSMHGFQLNKNLPELKPPPKKKKRASPQQDLQEVPEIKKETKPKTYSIKKTEIGRRIRTFIQQMRGEKQLYFWTITFPPGTSDDVAFILFNKWATRLRKEKMLKNYIWITERQENGTIHYHMGINHKMDIKKSNRYMRAAIFTCIDKGEIKYDRELAKNYNGIDISKDRKTRRITNFAKRNKSKALVQYLTKYITKNKGSFKHLAWHCSRSYSNLITTVRFTGREIAKVILKNFINYTKKIESEYFEFFPWLNQTPKDVTGYLIMVNRQVQDLLNKN